MTPKWLRGHTRAIKIVKKQGETNVFENGPSYAKHEQSDPQIIQKSAQSDPKRPPSAQSDPKVTSKRPQPVPELSQIDTTMIHSQPHTPKLNPKCGLKALQYYPLMPKVTPDIA